MKARAVLVTSGRSRVLAAAQALRQVISLVLGSFGKMREVQIK